MLMHGRVLVYTCVWTKKHQTWDWGRVWPVQCSYGQNQCGFWFLVAIYIRTTLWQYYSSL